MKRLTPKQSLFVHHVANGCSYTQAYREAYDTYGKVETIRTEASRLSRVPKVAAAIERSKPKTRAIVEPVSHEGLFWKFRHSKSPPVRLKAAVQLGTAIGLF